jgi:hypothetical protein
VTSGTPAEHDPARAPHNKFASLWCDACPRPTSGTPAPQEASKCEKSANVKSSAPARQITSGARTRSVDAESEKHNGTPAPRTEIFSKANRLAKATNQVVGEKHDLYVTLEQLMEIL